MQAPVWHDWLRLTLTQGVGCEAGRALLQAFGLPSDVFAQSRAALEQVVSAKQAKALLALPENFEVQVKSLAEWLGNSANPQVQRSLITLADAAYPTALLHSADPPLMLYAVGQVDAFARWVQRNGHTQSVALVGSRNPTPQGTQNAQDFAKTLRRFGACIVSGMALGVDGAAHHGALLELGAQAEGTADSGTADSGAAELATIAVVGTGLDRVYPKQHHELAHRICLNGVILSEYPLGTPPLPSNFPRRNRLIAGLSAGTLVVEAAVQSGSLITARLALELGKEVFAIPGSIHAAQAKGCHALIKQGAKLVESAQDILDELHIGDPLYSPPVHVVDAVQPVQSVLKVPAVQSPAVQSPAVEAQAGSAETTFSGPHVHVLQALGYDATDMDTLCSRTGQDAASLAVALLELELLGEVSRSAGGLFQRMGRA